MKTADFDYDLPEEMIAQTPREPRDASRLFVLKRSDGSYTHTVFAEIGEFLYPGDVLVLNETRVIPARLFSHKIPSGGRVEILLLRPLSETHWVALLGGKHLHSGLRLGLDDGIEAVIQPEQDGAERVISFNTAIEPHLARIGHTPLPPYIKTPLLNPERYQTVYAQQLGSAAAPTAGLHFTPQLLDSLRSQGVNTVNLTLHVGLDTFLPVSEDSPLEHKIHTEWCQVTKETADIINAARRNKDRIIPVGTTSVRALESAARASDGSHLIAPFVGRTDLFILPGFHFKASDAMVTNFHLPRSTLLMLVSAFAGRERILSAYEAAKNNGYRFYSFGDAMLII